MKIAKLLKSLFLFMNRSFSEGLLNKKDKIEQKFYSKIKNSFTVNGKLIYAGSLLKLAYEKFSNKTALICEDKSINYQELYFRSIFLSQKLRQIGVNPKDKIILYFENSIEFYIAYFAIWQVGGVVVPVNIFLHKMELANIINDCKPKVAIVSNSLKENWEVLKKEKLVNNFPEILSNEDFDWNEHTLKEIEKTCLEFKIDKLEIDKLCLLLYTSGTTGKSKGVMLSSDNIMTNLIQCYARLKMFGHKDGERFFSVLPLFHVFAQNSCLWLPIMTGSCAIVVKKIDRKLILNGLQKKPSIFFGFPALYGMLCLLKTAPLDSVRIFVSGADMLPDKIRSAFALIYGRKICSGYGLTEASPVVALNYHNQNMKTNVVGESLVGIECDIRDKGGKSLPYNCIGSLWIKGKNIMLGYYNEEEQTSHVLKDGWLCTGDLASLDKNNMLAIRGRSKELIIHKGFNIYPQEIENVLMSYSLVFKAAVFGKEEEAFGQIPIAFVAVKNKHVGLEKKLREHCAGYLAQYKIPRKFVCLDDLPLNNTGKVDKKRIFKDYESILY
ncbi:AMP-binding protein [Candidatus Babeliales bacterium]|nr:AMP-binding protein [Candidatus Babeliales bacterium]